MGQDEQLRGGTGLIRIDTFEITIAPLEHGDELALERQLRRGAEAAAGDHYTRVRPMLDAAKDDPADRAEILREAVRLTAMKVSVSAAALFDFRCAPDGLAIELYARGKRLTPGLDPKGLRAIITEINADQIAAALFQMIEGGPDKKSQA